MKNHKKECPCPVCVAAKVPKMQSVLVKFRPEQVEFLKAFSKKFGMSVSEIVRYGVDSVWVEDGLLEGCRESWEDEILEYKKALEKSGGVMGEVCR